MSGVPVFPEYVPTSANLIRHCAESWSDRPLFVRGADRLSYRDAESRSAALARSLLATGVGKGTRIALLAPNSAEWIVGWLAATRIGAVVVMLNTYNQAKELGWVLRHSDAQILLTVDSHLGHDYLERLERAIPGLADANHQHVWCPTAPYLRSIWTWGRGERGWAAPVSELLQQADAVDDGILTAVEAEVTPADPMVVVYSSGSTADPKGAIHSQGAVVRHAHNLGTMRDLTSDDVLYTPMPLFWVGGFSFSLVGAMHAGATLICEDRFEAGTTLELLERERVTHVLGWPHMTKALMDHPKYLEYDLSSLRGGTLPRPGASDEDPTPASLGMTETLGPHTFARKEPLPADKAGSYGFSVPGITHKIVDPVSLQELPVGETGELWVRGYSLMLGLHKKERAETFTPDGWYRTGDAGHFDADSHFYFTGRMGELIKSAGMNITPRDVETALEGLPEVALAFVCGVRHPDRGEDVVAAVALRPGEVLEEGQVRTEMKEVLASYKVPRHIAVFADQTELPWLDSGKIDRRRLASILEDRFDGA